MHSRNIHAWKCLDYCQPVSSYNIILLVSSRLRTPQTRQRPLLVYLSLSPSHPIVTHPTFLGLTRFPVDGADQCLRQYGVVRFLAYEEVCKEYYLAAGRLEGALPI